MLFRPGFRRHPRRRPWAFPFLVLFSLALTCRGAGQSFEKVNLLIESGGGETVLRVELARTGEQRSQGLMNRKKLDDGEGMLFIFDQDQILSFWMKDTLIPLSIAFINSDGRILEIRDMEPGNLNPVVSIRSGRYALEVPQGWFTRAGITPGDRVTLPGR